MLNNSDSAGMSYDAGRSFDHGLKLLNGVNVGGEYIQNDDMAFEQFNMAANLNHAKAMFMLWFCYFEGRGVQRDLVVAYQWLEKAANLGDEMSKWKLAEAYVGGEYALNKDLDKAKQLYLSLNLNDDIFDDEIRQGIIRVIYNTPEYVEQLHDFYPIINFADTNNNVKRN